MRTISYVFVAVIISMLSFLFGYTVGCRNGYICALIDKANNIEPEWHLVEQDNKEVIWKRNNNYKGISQ